LVAHRRWRARIAIRGKGYEREIDRKYLADLNEAYTHFFFHYTASPLLVVNTSDIDFVNRREDFEDVRASHPSIEAALEEVERERRAQLAGR